MVALLCALSMSTAQAEAPENLSYGELYGHRGGWSGNAYTTPKGMVSLHPFIRSSVGVTDFLDVKAAILGEIAGPNVAFELAPLQNERVALSVEAMYNTGWNFKQHTVIAMAHASVAPGDRVLLDASLGMHTELGDRQFTDINNNPAVDEGRGVYALRPELSATFRLGLPSALVFTARTNVMAIEEFGLQGQLGTYVVYGYQGFGLSAGANLALLGTKGLSEELDNTFVDPPNLPAAIPVPLPHAQLWFRI